MLRTRLLAPLLCGLVLLAACDDPSNVGIGLVDEQGEPEVRAFSASLFEAEPLKDITGNAQRVLAGQVEDPLLGTLGATAYLDFQRALIDTTGAPSITSVSLRLRPDYVYGDTTAPMTLQLFDMDADWVATGATADTVLPKGALVAAFDLMPTDTLTTVELPEAWIAANDTTLRSGTFEASFHGFALEALAGNAVMGFNGAGSRLRVVTERDTVDFPLFRTLTGLRRTGTSVLPPGVLAVQDGLGPSVKFNFNFAEGGLDETPINGAIIRLFADTLSVQAAPAHFVRPLQRRLQLVAIQDEASFLLAEATLNAEGHYRFSAPLAANLFSLRELLQRVFLGNEVFEHFELRTPTDNNTINVTLLFDAEAGPRAPEALLTLSPSGT